MRRIFAYIATSLASLTAIVHLLLGGADALAPTLSANLPPAAEGAMHACWHMISFFLILSAFAFWFGEKTAFHFAISWVVFAIIFIYVGMYQAGLTGLLTNPQWTILLTTAAMALLNHRMELKQQLIASG
jgi:hypothetical protein